MLQIEGPKTLPTSSELPSSDDIPVDNENQNFLPNYLLFLLEQIWKNRSDWYFGVDMAIYHTTGKSPRVPVVPDGFLSLGVPRRRNGRPRKSYTVWEEEEIVPRFALEVVSQTYGEEYGDKLAIYEKLGVLYYTIFNTEYWRRDRHQPLEIYKLVEGSYRLQIGEPFWMPEIGLALGRCQVTTGGLDRQVLSWFDESGDRYLSAEERGERMAAKLRELGVNPDTL